MTLSAVQLIPEELIGAIFMFCLPDETFISPNSRSAPLLLTQICSEWRRMAIAMPLLWASLSVNITPANSRPCLPLVHLWLDRSGSCPLSLALAHDDEENWADDGSENAAQVLEIFGIYWRRWKSYRICLPDPCPGYPVTTFPDDGPPLLENLCLHIGGDLTDEEVELVATTFTSAPRLTHLTWGYFYYDLDKRNVPWSQLTYLHLDCDVPVNAACRLLSLCFNLVAWHIDGISADGDREPSSPPLHIHQTALRILSLRSSFAPFLSHLTLPYLRELSVISDDSIPIRGQASSNAQHLLSFLTRSRCPLDSLVIDIAGFNEATVVECLYILSPSLISLEVQNEYVLPFSVDAIVSALTRPDESPSHTHSHSHVCPRLQSITFRPGLAATRGLVDAMVTSRCSRSASTGQIPVIHFMAA